MHRLDQRTALPKREKYPRWIFCALPVLNIGVAAYCLARDRHAFFAVGGVVVGMALLWNLYRTLNSGEIYGGIGQRPLHTRLDSPFGYWFSVILYGVLYILTLVIPPLVKYSASQ